MSKREKIPRPDVRCVTLNVEGLSHDWICHRSRTVARGLKQYRPDVVCLQESTIRYGSSIYDQAANLGRAIGLPFAIFCPYGNPIEVMSSDQGGIALLSRWPILVARSRKLPGGHDHPPDSRVAILADIDAPFGLLRVINLHLSWMTEESPIRLVQVGLLMDDLLLGECLVPGARTVLAGDFNANETEAAIQLAGEHLVDTFRKAHPNDPGFTYVRGNPLISKEFRSMPSRRLDYIFCSGHAEVLRAEVILNEPGTPFPSDHFGLLADLTWGDGNDQRM